MADLTSALARLKARMDAESNPKTVVVEKEDIVTLADEIRTLKARLATAEKIASA